MVGFTQVSCCTELEDLSLCWGLEGLGEDCNEIKKRILETSLSKEKRQRSLDGIQ